MMPPLLLALALALLPAAAAAETVRVRSGDHADRARLVVELAEPSDWRLGSVEGGYALDLAREDVEFDTAAVFRMITRDRIVALEQVPGESRLTIHAGCDCHATAMDFNGSWIVIDIVDGSAPPGSPFESLLDPAGPESDPLSPEGGGAAAAGIVPQLLGLPAPAVRLPALELAATAAEPPPAAELVLSDLTADSGLSAPMLAPPGAPEAGATDTPVAGQEAALLEELARAAAQGLLEPRLPALDRLQESHATSPAPDEPPPPEAHVRLRAETSIDRDAGASTARRDLTDAGIACLPDAVLDLPGWGDGGDPAAGIAARRAKLVGEFDRPDPEAVLGLVRYYLHLGFGAEAVAVLAAFDIADPQAGVLRALAALVDGTGAGLPGPLAGQTSCGGAVALWSVLAERGPHPGDEADTGAMVAAFSALPLHLRRALGPDLAARFLEAGDKDTALRLRNAIARAVGASSDPGAGEAGLALFDARLALAEGDPAAPAALASLVAADEATAAAAWQSYLEHELAAGRAPPAGAEIAAALAFELSGRADGAALAELAVLNLLARGEFDAARTEVERIMTADPGGADRLWPAFADRLTQGAADGTFLALYFAMRDRLANVALPPGLGLAMAARLTGLGFPEEALRLLPEPGGDEARRLARAQALLTDGKAVAAMAELAPLDGSEAELARARALVALGDAGAAVAHYDAAGRTDSAERAAWLAGDWERLGRSGNATLRTLSDARMRSPAVAPAAGQVAAARDALVAAVAARAAVTDLLAAPPWPSGSP